MTHFPHDAMNNLVGQTIDHGRYEILRIIGEGGTGRVYEAKQTRVHRLVAIKVLHNHWITDPKLVKRFKQEAFTASQLRHPNTVMVIDYGATETGDLYIVMELLKGQSLLALLEQEGPLSIHRSLKIIEQICGAVSEVHRCGILHRDLKPENVQIDPRDGHPDFVKLLDFSIAKLVNNDVISSVSANQNLTLQGAVFGTPQYMSPEQVRGKDLDERTDVYALGVIFYQMLSGFVPFYENTPQGTMVAHLTEPVPRFEDRVPHLDIHPDAAQLVYDCLEKDPEERVGSSEALMQRLLKLKTTLHTEAKLKESGGEQLRGDTIRFTSTASSDTSQDLSNSDSVPTEIERPVSTERVGSIDRLSSSKTEEELPPPPPPISSDATADDARELDSKGVAESTHPEADQPITNRTGYNSKSVSKRDQKSGQAKESSERVKSEGGQDATKRGHSGEGQGGTPVDQVNEREEQSKGQGRASESVRSSSFVYQSSSRAAGLNDPQIESEKPYSTLVPTPPRLSTLESLIEDPFSARETQEYQPEVHGELKSKLGTIESQLKLEPASHPRIKDRATSASQTASSSEGLENSSISSADSDRSHQDPSSSFTSENLSSEDVVSTSAKLDSSRPEIASEQNALKHAIDRASQDVPFSKTAGKVCSTDHEAEAEKTSTRSNDTRQGNDTSSDDSGQEAISPLPRSEEDAQKDARSESKVKLDAAPDDDLAAETMDAEIPIIDPTVAETVDAEIPSAPLIGGMSPVDHSVASADESAPADSKIPSVESLVAETVDAEIPALSSEEGEDTDRARGDLHEVSDPEALSVESIQGQDVPRDRVTPKERAYLSDVETPHLSLAPHLNLRAEAPDRSTFDQGAVDHDFNPADTLPLQSKSDQISALIIQHSESELVDPQSIFPTDAHNPAVSTGVFDIETQKRGVGPLVALIAGVAAIVFVVLNPDILNLEVQPPPKLEVKILKTKSITTTYALRSTPKAKIYRHGTRDLIGETPFDWTFESRAPDDKFDVKASGYKSRLISFSSFESAKRNNTRTLTLKLEKRVLQTSHAPPQSPRVKSKPKKKSARNRTQSKRNGRKRKVESKRVRDSKHAQERHPVKSHVPVMTTHSQRRDEKTYRSSSKKRKIVKKSSPQRSNSVPELGTLPAGSSLDTGAFKSRSDKGSHKPQNDINFKKLH